jgi:hypothetical protein
MIKYTIFSLIALLLVGELTAQTTVTTNTVSKHKQSVKNKVCIRGTVINAESNQPVVGVKLQLGNSLLYTIADASGNFSFELDTANCSKYGSIINVTASGYETRQVHLVEFLKRERTIALFKQLSIQEPEPESIDGIKQEIIETQSSCSLIAGVRCVFVLDDTEPIITYVSHDLRYFITNSVSFPNRDQDFCR